MASVGTDTLAEILNLTRRRINQLTEQGVLTRSARGKYDLLVCVKAYVRYLQAGMKDKSAMSADGDLVSTKQERALMLSAQRQREELKLAHERGDTMSVDLHAKILADMVVQLKGVFRALGARLASKLAAESEPLLVRRAIEAEVDAALSIAAKKTPRLPPHEDAA
jgi:phage terminase Nu1 subunit (DNA packaging protein)